ncbi:hypothetical protein GEMRC1_003848 [Eukaryota sp. GEM-RC1]
MFTKKKLPTIPPAILKPKPLWTGKQVISSLIQIIVGEGVPLPNIRANGKVSPKIWTPLHEEESVLLMRSGDLLCGVLDKNQIGPSKFGLVHSINELYGPQASGRLLSSLGRLCTTVLQYYGCSVGISDMVLTAQSEDERHRLIDTSTERGFELASKFTFEELMKTEDVEFDFISKDQLATSINRIYLEPTLYSRLDGKYSIEMSELAGEIIDSCINGGQTVTFPRNNLSLMALIGAKGSNVNVSQISALLGQQTLEGRRVPVMPSGRTLPSFSPYDSSPKSGGFVADRFLTGVTPQMYYFHCMAGREGLIDTAIKTANSGYLQRCVIKALEDISIAYDGTVRQSDGLVMQFLYGEDGLNTRTTKFLNRFGFMAANYKPLIHAANFAAVLPKLDVTSAKNLKNEVDTGADPVLSRISPFSTLGATSEAFNKQLEAYIAENPHGLVSLSSDLTPEKFRTLMNFKYQQYLAHPGEAVGAVCGQSIGEPSTQMTLNTFHLAGHGAANVTLGIPRLREIIMMAAKVIATPVMHLKLLPGKTERDAKFVAKLLSRVGLSDVWGGMQVTTSLEVKKGAPGSRVYNMAIKLDRDDLMKSHSVSKEQVFRVIETAFLPKLVMAITRDLKKSGDQTTVVSTTTYERERKYLYLLQKKVAMGNDDDEEPKFDLNQGSDSEGEGQTNERSRGKKVTDYDSEEDAAGDEIDDEDEDEGGEEDELNVKIKKPPVNTSKSFTHPFVRGYSFSKNGFEVTFHLPARLRKVLMVSVAERTAKSIYIKEVKGITNVRVLSDYNVETETQDYSIQTEGVNFEAAWALRHLIDINQMTSTDINHILKKYGVEACRSSIVREINMVFSSYGIDVDLRHLYLLADYMTHGGGYRPLNRIGMDTKPSPFLKMSFGNHHSIFNKVGSLQ